MPEVLVALVVIGFLLLGLTNGAHLGITAHDIQARWLDRQAGLEPVDRAIRKLISQADPGSFEQPAGLVGSANRLELVTRLPIAGGAASARRITALLLVNRDHELMLQWLPTPHAVQFVPFVPERTIVLEHVERLEIAYWRSAEDGGGWLRTWADRGLPALVRIRLVFPKGDPRHWPDIIARPMREVGTT